MRKISQQKFDEIEVREELYKDPGLPKDDLELLNEHFNGGKKTTADIQLDNIKDVLGERENRKANRWHRKLLKVEQLLTWTNILIGGAIFIMFCTHVAPYLAYTFHAVDRHYFGFFNEREPLLAKTTSQETFYKEHDIPYRTVQMLEEEKKHHLHR
mmetsp:Transcript_33602/g.51745  ORF Transcript_33602/g.51745 Transcript_33602/m.51745 type:complete len:156 (-) Transcript_33602:2293-2760(-)